MADRKIQVFAYYFPNFHADPLNEAFHGKNWTEWEVARCARARFPGHNQPKVPLWGYEDESDPKVMARKIACAREYGVNGFIFDWYFSEEGSFRERALNEGFLPVSGDFPFALMWCNHRRANAHPAPYTGNIEIGSPAGVSPDKFEVMTDHIVKDYFSQPNYLKIDGKPYFSIFVPGVFLRMFGSAEAAAAALERFRAKARRAGFPGIHLHFNYDGLFHLFDGLEGRKPFADDDPLKNYRGTPADLVRLFGLDSTGAYNWSEHCTDFNGFPRIDAELLRQDYLRFLESHPDGVFTLPYSPTVTTGWDPSPRTVQSDMFERRDYPWTGVWEQSPAEFGAMLRAGAHYLKTRSDDNARILTIGAWNEWTEGSYLEPDTRDGYAFLEEVRSVFKPSK
ncbi:glycoside hydrolase family 99-like domain-containing protein [uncultured Victivallis sp.]|uniref:glycoside hydrolase family 99-like domain-containing protein n=1 Tax=uncultured Victivallis sp. TaxID=354118 RepID=UPI002598D390|nr:glycoside hydrolase family 99-like domain-containing protein [uncultured Victivallis sp.]